jgi:cytoskeletal protein CcmA (bactofilin family)
MIWRRGEHKEEQTAPPAEPPRQESEREQPRQERHEGRRGMAEDREVTVVGQGAALEGNIVSSQSLRVDGRIKGQINAEGDVILSQQSQVDADIKAENATVAGQFKGNIVVKGRVELTKGGRVDGNITCKTLVVQEGAIFQGQSIMDQRAQRSEQGRASQIEARPAQQGETVGEPVNVPDAETSDV